MLPPDAWEVGLPGAVLLVEDDELVLMLIQDSLEDAGFAVTVTREGQEALRRVSEGEEAVLITDINLGAAMDGWAVARGARELKPQLKVIYVTGDSGHEWAAQGVPGSVLIEKPFAPAQIVTAVASLMLITGGAAGSPPP
jgi:CheY-like chemotaxis protein